MCMRNAFHELDARLLRTSRMVADAMDLATRAVADADADLAADAVAEGARIALILSEAEEQAHTIPVLEAGDLGAVVSAVHAIGDLNRMGRLAVHVAEAVRRRCPEPVVPHVLAARFAEMGRIAVWLATMAGQVLESRDVALARTLIAVDDDMDDLHRTLFTVLDYRDWAYGAATAVDVAQLSRCYERFADHAVSLARQSTFGVIGFRPDRPTTLDRAALVGCPPGGNAARLSAGRAS